MDARLRRWLAGVLPLAMFATGTTGCSLFDRSTDRLVQDQLNEAKQTMRRPGSDPLAGSGPPVTTVRPQSPVGPQVVTPPVAQASPVEASGPVAPPRLMPAVASGQGVRPASPSHSDGELPPQFAAETGVARVAARTAASMTPSVLASSGPAPEIRVKVVATVGPDGLITDDDVLMMMRQRARDYLMLSGTERDVKEREVYREELRRLIERELVIHEFLSRIRKNKPQLVDELWEEAGRMADRQMRDIRRSANLTKEAEFTQMLQAQGMTAAGFRRQLERTALSNMYVSQYMREKTRTAGLAQVRDYYLQHPEQFRIEDRVKWQDLFISTRRFRTPDEAKIYTEWLLKSLQAGGDFAQLAKEYGHGDSALRGGDGTGTKRGEIQPVELEATVFSLEAGKTSGLIPTSTGYHIVRVLERDVAGVRPFDDKLQNEIRSKLAEAAYKLERDKMVAELWRKTTVTIVGE